MKIIVFIIFQVSKFLIAIKMLRISCTFCSVYYCILLFIFLTIFYQRNQIIKPNNNDKEK